MNSSTSTLDHMKIAGSGGLGKLMRKNLATVPDKFKSELINDPVHGPKIKRLDYKLRESAARRNTPKVAPAPAPNLGQRLESYKKSLPAKTVPAVQQNAKVLTDAQQKAKAVTDAHEKAMESFNQDIPKPKTTPTPKIMPDAPKGSAGNLMRNSAIVGGAGLALGGGMLARHMYKKHQQRKEREAAGKTAGTDLGKPENRMYQGIWNTVDHKTPAGLFLQRHKGKLFLAGLGGTAALVAAGKHMSKRKKEHEKKLLEEAYGTPKEASALDFMQQEKVALIAPMLGAAARGVATFAKPLARMAAGAIGSVAGQKVFDKGQQLGAGS